MIFKNPSRKCREIEGELIEKLFSYRITHVTETYVTQLVGLPRIFIIVSPKVMRELQYLSEPFESILGHPYAVDHSWKDYEIEVREVKG